ncbi:hypothetical protein BJ508DRAFT_313142 [Ascobolus immersus RN42]|uniref:Uncharacterized protein n=1 Tax=Ascobolus immersus RN42 TaxID=1160509 RepID=A0A3N4HLJ8_ASCIM|nr:hypothetical protein BJ508DRAFT_313142 [Ascobolus immersus RN42]
MSEQDLWKPDLLHTIYEGMVPHLLSALELFLAHHGCDKAFEEAYMRIPSFGSISAAKRSIFDTTQRTGKSLREALRHLLPALVIALDKPKAREANEFYDCLAACRYLVDFSLICTYRYHTSTSLGYMQKYLDGFHRHKNVFNPYRPEPNANEAPPEFKVTVEADDLDRHFFKGTSVEEFSAKERENRERNSRDAAKKAKKKAMSALQKTAKVLFETDKEKLQDWLEMSDSVDFCDFQGVIPILEEIASNVEKRFLDDDAFWKIPKLHLLCHFVDSVRRFGYLQQYSSEVGETLHKGIKEGYRFSSNNSRSTQILQFHTRKFAVRMREMNLKALAKEKQYEAQIQEALSLYGRREDRLLAAQLRRKGAGSIQTTEYYMQELKRSLETTELAVVADGVLKAPSNELVPTDAPWYFPSPLPLFPQDVKRATGRKLWSRYSQTGYGLNGIAESFGLEKLHFALKEYLVTELDYPADSLTKENLNDLKAHAFQSLAITTYSFQAQEPLEVFKCFCTGNRRAPRAKVPRNDTVVFMDDDEYSQHSKAMGLHSDFGGFRFGTLKSLLRVWIPKLEHIEEFKMMGSYCQEDRFTAVDVVYLEGYQPVRCGDRGETIPGALIGKCTVAQKIQG